MTKFDPTESPNQILFVSMLQIWNLRYFEHFWIMKHVGFELIIFTINLNATSSSKVFSTFNSMFISIVLVTESINLSI